MKINLRTFEFVTYIILLLGIFSSLSMIAEIRILGFAMVIGSVFLLHEIGEERKRIRRKNAFYHRMGKLVEARLAA